jgi:hypothetical protein
MKEDKMLSIQGYFEAGRFITDTSVSIPERKKTIITVLDENIDDDKERAKRIKLWGEIIEEIRSCDEKLEGEPERIKFREPEELGV